MKRYKTPELPPDPYKAQALPTDEKIAVYYRQSGEGQIGNIGTTLQTVDMVEHLKRLGWLRERILMIDMDAGVSGTKKIKDRIGMSRILYLIEKRLVKVVAAQDVDRFFRDVWQIEVNVFIKACADNQVLVLTPTMIYDFNHPIQGKNHIKQFRDEAQRAWDYLEYQIKGRLVKSRTWLSEHGLWSGRRVVYGFMVDRRREFPDKTRNPNFREYLEFKPHAEVIRGYFQLFHDLGPKVSKVWEHIQSYGPFFPEPTDVNAPEGFQIPDHMVHRSRITGRLCPSPNGLELLLTNVVYAGHWVFRGAIVRRNNHPAIVPLELFNHAFNTLSSTDFLGERNSNYIPQRPYVRHEKANRTCEEPTYSGLIFSDDVLERPHA